MFNIEWDESLLNEVKNPAKKTYEKIPDGTYTATVDEFKIDVEKEFPRISMTTTITEGDFAKRKVWGNYSLSEKAKYIFAKEMAKLGVDVSKCKDLDSLQAALNSVAGVTASIYVKTNPSKQDPNKTFTNVYINDLIDRSAATPPKTDDGEDLPF